MNLFAGAGVDRGVEIRAGELVDEAECFRTEGGLVFIEDEGEEMFAGAARESEAGDFLVFAVFEDFEILRGEVARDVAFFVSDDGVDEDFVCVGLEVGDGRRDASEPATLWSARGPERSERESGPFILIGTPGLVFLFPAGAKLVQPLILLSYAYNGTEIWAKR